MLSVMGSVLVSILAIKNFLPFTKVETIKYRWMSIKHDVGESFDFVVFNFPSLLLELSALALSKQL
jgi:hypothetical protein